MQWIRQHTSLIGLVLITLVAYAAIPHGRSPSLAEVEWQQYNASLIAAHTRARNAEHDARIIAEHNLAVVKIDAARARVTYWAARAKASRQVAALPPATITGDTIRIADVPYVVPHPVALAWAQRDTAIGTQSDALQKGDSAVIQTVNEVAATDSVKDHAVKEADNASALATDQAARADAAEAQVKESRSFLSRLKRVAVTVGWFGAGAIAGATTVIVVLH